jgi:hypothetical protein
MKWQCTLLQRWLPEYPDGDLPAFWKGRLKSHLERCPGCRQELAAMGEVVKAIKAEPVADPGPEFWADFSRELHVKLVHAAQEAQDAPLPRLWIAKLPYLLGIPALAALLLWTTVHFSNPERPGLAPAPQLATEAAPEAARPIPVPQMALKEAPDKGVTTAKSQALPPARQQMARVPGEEVPVGATADRMKLATMGTPRPAPEDDSELFNLDLDAEFNSMTDEEKEAFLQRLQDHKKDGSWLVKLSPIFWA